MKKVLFILAIVISFKTIAQVKIGNNPGTIDLTSILELESANKVLVVTRMTNTQMINLTPLNGAIVYNTDENCLFQYSNNSWTSLCLSETIQETLTSIVDNNDGTFTYTDENGSTTVIDVAKADNGLTKIGNSIHLGGKLIQSTEIETSTTNTLAIKYLENSPSDVNGTITDHLVTVNPTTGVLTKTVTYSLFQELVLNHLAIHGQTEFSTPSTIVDVRKVNVFRNGVRLGFTKVNTNTIQLEAGVVCYQDDDIKIVQFN